MVELTILNLNMDYDPDWSNRGEVTQTQWKSPQQYSPSLYSNFKSQGNLPSTAEHSDTTYTSEGDQSHFSYSSSPEDLRYCSYSPQSHLPNEMNRNVKYIPYPNRPLRYKDNSTYSNCHQFHRNIRLNTGQEAKKYYSQMCQHKLVNMYPDPYLGSNYTTKTKYTALNIKKRRKTNESKSKRAKAADSLNSTLENYTYEKLIINNNNPMQNCSSNSMYLTLPPEVSQNATGIDPLINVFNRQHSVPENKDESCSVRKEHFTSMYFSNNTNFKVENFDEIVSTPARDYSSIKPIKEEDLVSNEIEVSEVNLNKKTEINGKNTEHLDHTGASVQETLGVTTGNANIQTRDSIQQEESFENVILQPIFEGKDEKGEDVIVLLVSSAIHQEIPPKNSNMELNTELSYTQLIKNSEENKEFIPLDEIQFQTSPGFQTEEEPCPENEINSQQNALIKSLNENYKESGLQIEGTDVFFSNINDFVSKEAEVAIENKSSNIKRTKKKDCQLPNNKSLRKTLNQREIHNFLSEDNSKATGLVEQKLYAPNTPWIRNCKKLKASYKPRKFKWKGNYRSKSKLQYKSFKNLFISEIKKLFKVKDMSVNRNKTWELLKNQIGCSVLQSIFTTFLQLAENEAQKSKSTTSTRK